MARIAGIKLHKTPGGKVKSVTIDLKKHSEFLPLLEQIGAVEPDEDAEFEKKFSEGFTKDQAIEKVLSRVKALPWKE